MIKLENIEVIENEVGILKRIDLEIKYGQWTMLFYKSEHEANLLIKLLQGRIKPSQGTYLLEGRNPLEFTQRQFTQLRKNIIINFDDISFSAQTSIEYNLNQQLKFSGIYPTKRKKLLKQCLNELGLNELSAKGLDQLTNFEKTKVKLAVVMIIQPKLCIFKNPFRDLNQYERSAYIDIFKGFLDKGITIFMISNTVETFIEGQTVLGLVNGEITKDINLLG